MRNIIKNKQLVDAFTVWDGEQAVPVEGDVIVSLATLQNHPELATRAGQLGVKVTGDTEPATGSLPRQSVDDCY